MNNNSQQKTLALYSKNRYQNKTSATTLAPNSSTHLRHNSNFGMNRRNEYQKNFSPTGYEPFDRERMEEELSKLIREINKKSKEQGG